MSGGAIEFVGTSAGNSGLKLLSGATSELGSGAFLSGAQVGKGITYVILAGGTAFGGTISAGALAIIESGGAVTSDGSGNPLFINSGGTFEFLGTGNTGASIQLFSGATLELGSGVSFGATGGDFNAGITAMVLSAGALTLSGATISASTLIETLSSGTIFVDGALGNSGTLIASGPGSLTEIASDAVVGGGAVVIGNGVVDVLSGGTANIAFLANGSGGLEIADSPGNVSAFTGTVSGFGGMNHTNHKQFIDLVSVTSAANTISLSYVPAAGSGTLFVSSGGAVVAQINMIGSYTSANFSIKADSNGNVEIVDPTVPNGASVAPEHAQTFPRNGIDLPDIAFGAQTTLAYAKHVADTGGTLTVSDGRHAASVALLGSYIAASFVIAADGHGGTLLTAAEQAQQPQLTHPPHG
jgi:trimeric autotransporter adhesin